MFITNGTVCDFLVTQCLTHPDEKRHNRFSMIIMPADAPGVTRNKILGKLGIRASDTAEVSNITDYHLAFLSSFPQRL